MKPRTQASVAAIAALASLAFFFSCAGQPAPAPEPVPEPAPEATSAASEAWEETPAPAPAKVQKERTVIVKVPVLLKETVFYPDGLVDEYVTYKYDQAMVRLLEKATFDPSRPEPIERAVYEYAGDSRLPLAEAVYEADGRIRIKREFAYDASGRLLSERLLDAKGQLQGSSTWVYDAQGRKAEWKVLDGKGLLQATTLYAYNGAGRVERIDMKNAAGGSTGAIKVEYAGTGQVEKSSYLAADGSLQKYELTDAKEGRALSFASHRPDGSLAQALAYEYGPLGELLASRLSDGQGRLKERRAYEYAVREDKKIEVYFE